MLKEGEAVPELFDDPVMKRASHWVLSTSALVSKHLREYGWGEVCIDWVENARVFFLTGIRLYQMGLGSHTSLALMVRLS